LRSKVDTSDELSGVDIGLVLLDLPVEPTGEWRIGGLW
jgi:hypothetical protein